MITYLFIQDACDRKDANEEIIKMLLKAEEKNIALKKETEPHEKIKRRYVVLWGSITETYLSWPCFDFVNNESHNFSPRSTHLLDDRKRSPLYLAVKAGADEKVISLLLESERKCCTTTFLENY